MYADIGIAGMLHIHSQGQTSSKVHTAKVGNTYIHTYIHTYIQTDRQTDAQLHRQTDRQTYIYMYDLIYYLGKGDKKTSNGSDNNYANNDEGYMLGPKFYLHKLKVHHVYKTHLLTI